MALGDAAFESYKLGAIDFVRTFMPPLVALAAEIERQAGSAPEWQAFIHRSVSIYWSVPAAQPVPGGIPYDLVRVWPRTESTLHSGEPISSPDAVSLMIGAIRAHGATV
jgi:hypothetical protein